MPNQMTSSDPTMPGGNYPSGNTNAVIWTDDGTVPKPLPKRYITLTNNTDRSVYPSILDRTQF